MIYILINWSYYIYLYLTRVTVEKYYPGCISGILKVYNNYTTIHTTTKINIVNKLQTISRKLEVFLDEENMLALVSILPGICPQLRTRIFRFVLI